MSGGQEVDSSGPSSLSQDALRLRSRGRRDRRPSSDTPGNEEEEDDDESRAGGGGGGAGGTSRSWSFWNLFSPTWLILFCWRTFNRVTFGAVCTLVLVWASLFIYVTFYYIYIPGLDNSRAIHFQFDATCGQKEGCSIPFGEIPLGADFKAPSIFAKGQQYKFTLDMDLPESEVNWDQGMFMVRLKLFDASQRLITVSSRPALLKYKSFLLRILSVFAYLPFFVTGLRQEYQHLSVPLIEDYIDASRPKLGTAVLARVELEARQLQVYSSILYIHTKLTGLKYLMVNWPVMTGLLGTATIFGFLALITVCSVYRVVSKTDDEDAPNFYVGDNDDDEDEDEENDSEESPLPSGGRRDAADEYDAPDSTFNE